jgi:hypothetical protein
MIFRAKCAKVRANIPAAVTTKHEMMDLQPRSLFAVRTTTSKPIALKYAVAEFFVFVFW